MKRFNAISLGLLMAASSAAFASNNGAVVHFKGHVSEPTCTVTSGEQTVTLDTIGASEVERVSIGQAVSAGEKNFQLTLSCEESGQANHVVMQMQGMNDTKNQNILKNSAIDNGVGLEVFYKDRALQPGAFINGSRFSSMNNKGDNNLEMKVRYARLGDEVKGGDVNADVVFVTEYR